jgi:CheY-like chemotaxis protein
VCRVVVERCSCHARNNPDEMKRLLVVDDRELANVLAFALQRQGYVVEPAANGRDALDRVRRGRWT